MASGFSASYSNQNPAPCPRQGTVGRGREPVFLLPGKQSTLAQDFFAEFGGQAVAQQEAGIRGIADAEARNGFFIKAASQQILPGSRSFGALQAFLKKCGCALLDVEQLCAELGFFRLSGAGVRGFGQRNPQLLRYQPEGFGKSDVLDFLHEAEDVS